MKVLNLLAASCAALLLSACATHSSYDSLGSGSYYESGTRYSIGVGYGQPYYGHSYYGPGYRHYPAPVHRHPAHSHAPPQHHHHSAPQPHHGSRHHAAPAGRAEMHSGHGAGPRPSGAGPRPGGQHSGGRGGGRER
jgi:hypothetical protein